MPSAATIRIAIASDLHAYANDGSSPSHLDVRAPENLPNQHPLAGLLKLIEDEHLDANAVLSPGDLGHQASVEGIKYAWSALHNLKAKLRASLVAGTAGNHDIDSRYQGDNHAPEHILKGLVPAFPLDEEILDDRYWARAYTIKDHDQFRLLLVNSSAYHGHTDVEKNHGRIDVQTLEDIRIDLKRRGVRDVNILLCHHHPHQHSELELGGSDVMKQGQLLLDLLGSGEFGRWLVIHGHKHHPKITYASGGASAPVVFAAGSLCCKLFLPIQTVARNQFYIVQIEPEQIDKFGLVGRIRAWDWASGTGWIPAGEGSGLPSEFGFGYRGDPSLLAHKIAEAIGSQTSALRWRDLAQEIPEIQFVLPQDLLQMQKQLSVKNGIRVTKDNGVPRQIGRGI